MDNDGVGKADELKYFRADDIRPYEFYRAISFNIVGADIIRPCFLIYLLPIKNYFSSGKEYFARYWLYRSENWALSCS